MRSHGDSVSDRARRSVVLLLVPFVGLTLFLQGCPDAVPAPDAEVALELITDNLTAPVELAAIGDGRLLVVDQVGVIGLIDIDGNLSSTPFLDIRDRMISLSPVYDERGLLGLALHPNYADNGRFYVTYNAPSGGAGVDTVLTIAEFTVSNDPDRADANSERVLLTVEKVQPAHNGGKLAFGPEDGFLYIGIGDGGGANDTGAGHTPNLGNGQDRTKMLGKILRIDVDSGDPYAIPADNPFVDDDETLDEIWAFGLRNPWRFSFDRGGENRMFIGDVGQELFEEVNIGVSGGNYGWNIREGSRCFDPSRPSSPPDECATTGANGEPLVDPIMTIAQFPDVGRRNSSVIAGFVYRGSAIPELAGQFIFGDYSAQLVTGDGTLYAAEENEDGSWTRREIGMAGRTNNRLNRFLFGIAEDDEGELYLLSSNNLGPSGVTGAVHKIVPME